jgi:hypothetical protein
MRLYASGTLFNGLYSIMRTQQSSLSSLEDMRPTHLLIVMGLAFMGLVTVSEGVTTQPGVGRYDARAAAAALTERLTLAGYRLAACATR